MTPLMVDDRCDLTRVAAVQPGNVETPLTEADLYARPCRIADRLRVHFRQERRAEPGIVWKPSATKLGDLVRVIERRLDRRGRLRSERECTVVVAVAATQVNIPGRGAHIDDGGNAVDARISHLYVLAGQVRGDRATGIIVDACAIREDVCADVRPGHG